DIVAGAANFSARISAGFAGYGLTQQQSDDFAVVNAELQSAFAAASTPETRTPVAIARKDTALAGMRNQAKLLARIIYATPSVTDAQLAELGLLPRRAPRPIPAATEPPIVEVTGVTGRRVTIRIRGGEGQAS